MSAASRWAETAADLRAQLASLNIALDGRPTFAVEQNGLLMRPAEVDPRGNLRLSLRTTLSPSDALEFARWLQDTFSDE